MEKKPLTLYLVRHGEAGGESRPDEVGPPLTARGEKQAAKVARRLANQEFDHIYSSDMSRSYHTAQAIIAYHASTPYTVSADIREVSVHHVLPGRTPRQKAIIDRMAGSEKSVKKFLRQLLKNHGNGEKILLAIHGNLIRLLLYKLAERPSKRGLPLMITNTSLSVAHLVDGVLDRVELVNCVKHLKPGEYA
jgi:broad specificity phosphatase PhoE